MLSPLWKLLWTWITLHANHVKLRPWVCGKVLAKCVRINGLWMTVAMENVKEWSGRMKNVEDDSGSLILGVNYSNFLQLISTLCDSAVTILSLCGLWSTALHWKLLLTVGKTSIKAVTILSHFLQNLDINFCWKCICYLLAINPILCFAGIEERSGSSPWGPGEQNSQSFNQRRVWFIPNY